MKIISCLSSLMLAQAVEKRYNILSLDAAKYKGYMTANFISFLE